MGSMRGKLTEMTKYQLLLQKQLSAATVYYNGQPATTQSGYGINTSGYSDVDFLISIGAQDVGSLMTIQHTILGSATDNPLAATAITGIVAAGISVPATFNVVAGQANTLFEGSVQAKDQPQFLFLQTTVLGSLQTVDYCAIAVLGNDNQAPVKTLQFDL